ncbi:MAG: hypothetical protein GY696_20140 [Gammaproteobacteria bacterium]|nr:hypothetical protein [Gammaproteobacteria bacterium]
MSSLQIRAVRLVEVERTHLIQGRSTYEFWQGLELQGSPWTPYPITRKQGSAKQPCRVDPWSLWGRRKGPVAANTFTSRQALWPALIKTRARLRMRGGHHTTEAMLRRPQVKTRRTSVPTQLSKQEKESCTWRCNPPS